jgi:hypothetical protein
VGKDLKVPDIIAKLQRHRGYQGWRISPHWSKANFWIAEYYTYIGRGDKKGWRVLRDEQERCRTFRTAQLAYTTLAKQQAEWQKELGERDQTFEVVNMGEEKRLGRIYPFCYKQWHDEAEEALGDLLRVYGDGVIWLLDIRFDPDGPPYEGFRGSWLKHMRPRQYRHAKGLGLVHGQLHHPASAVKKMLELVQEGESFVLFSGNREHVKMVETRVRDEAKRQGVPLEDPYALHSGDLCRWFERDTGQLMEVVLHHRMPDVYRFVAGFPGVGQSLRVEYVDVRDLQMVTAQAYRCEKCKQGVVSVAWREKPQQKLCHHCFWEWELEDEDEEISG